MEPFQILIVVAIICVIIEVFSPLFVFASFAVGFLFASYGSYMDYSSTNQIYGFVIGSGLSFVLVKPIFQKYAYNKDSRRMNQENIIGRNGIVVSEIDNNLNKGSVKIDGVNWKAYSVNGDIIKENENIKVVEIDSIILHVIKNNEL